MNYKKSRIAVHLHLYYTNQLGKYLRKIKNLDDYNYDLFVTMNHRDDNVIAKIKKFRENAKIKIVENRGYDVGPFIEFINEIDLNKYDLIIKLHTKNASRHKNNLNGFIFTNRYWANAMLNRLLGSKKQIKNNLRLFKNSNVGMAGCIEFHLDGFYEHLMPKIKKECKYLGIKRIPDISFFAGTSFIARSSVFQCLKNKYKIKDFENVSKSFSDGQLAHVMERMLGIIAKHNGFVLYGIDNRFIRLKKWFSKWFGHKIPRFFYRVEQKPNLKTIKILKIPVYKKKIGINPVEYGNWLRDLRTNKSLFVPLADTDFVRKASDVKIFAYYLTQFHSIPENDDAHGKGFTEWTNSSRANAFYAGHFQPKTPYDVGFYNLLDVQVMRRQAQLAKKYGVYGWCFYYYWFAGKRVLEKPLENFLNSDIDLPFHLCWANENWSRLWDGGSQDVILAQETKLNAKKFFQDLLPFIKDKRYEKIDNKPILMIYRPSMFERDDMKCFVRDMNNLAKENGFAGFFFTTSNFQEIKPQEYGLDALTEFPPHGVLADASPRDYIDTGALFSVCSMTRYINNKLYIKECDCIQFKACFPSWDNTPRKAYSGGVVYEITNQEFESWLKGIIKWTKEHNAKNMQYCYINAWNEWAEGAVLEPTTRYGYQNLQTVRKCLEDSKKN